MPVPNDIVHGNSTGGCGCHVWAIAPSSPVSGVHWSSRVVKIIEPLTIVLGEPLGSRMCYGGGRQPAKRYWSHDVEHSNSGTICDVVASDVVGNAMGLWHPPSGPGAPVPLPASTCPSGTKCEYCFGKREPSSQ